MNLDDIKRFKLWFKDHIVGICRDLSDEDLSAIFLKEQHTYRVIKDILLIAGDLDDVSGEDILIAETIGLFHDIGRFIQWKEYRTFVDSKSRDHALLGLEVLSRHRTLNCLPLAEREVVEEAIRYHNTKDAPEDLDARALFFTKLIRDADKLDIWRVVTTHRPGESPVMDQLVFGEMPPSPSFSRSILDSLLKGDKSDMRLAETQNDLKLLRLGWMFDLNFEVSCREVLKRGYVKKIIAQLPTAQNIQDLEKYLMEHLARSFRS
jgi:hypothetical protein